MEWDQETLQTLSQCFLHTLSPNPEPRRAAEEFLTQAADRPNYGLAVLRLLAEPTVDDHIRQAAAVNFKNHLRSRWAPSDSSSRNLHTTDAHLTPISKPEKDQIKSLIVHLMLQSGPKVQSQLSEALAIVGKHDFPKSWPSLLPELVSALRQSSDYASINGILGAANSIFKKFRYEYKTRELLFDLKYCLDGFAAPLLDMFLKTSAMIDSGSVSLQPLFESQRLCCRIFYSLNIQELPEFFEDHMEKWMSEFLKYLTTNYPSLEGSADGLPIVDGLRAAVCENINLYLKENEEEFQPYLGEFAKAVWSLLIGVSGSTGRERLTITAIRFLITITTGVHHTLFAGEFLRIICESVVIPNVRLSAEDEELFEMNYVEFIRRDMEGSDVDTRRRIACELLRGLAEKYEDQVSDIIRAQIDSMLINFVANPATNWKEMDCAIYLVISLATRRAGDGGSSVSTDLIDVGSFFNNVIVPQLQSQDVNGFPMLKAGSLKFFTMFRDQIPKQVVVSLMPDVVRFLMAESNVVHSYASICIEKLLLVKEEDKRPRYTSSDVSPFLPVLLTNLFEAMKFPESEENPYVMKCIMRVLGVADFSAEVAGACITGLTSILNEVCKNPKNPIFNHYLFEAVAGLVKRACAKDISLISAFEASLFPIIQTILAKEVIEFWPYAFQLLAQLVELSRSPLHQNHMHMFELLLSQDMWKKSANVPALVRLLQAFLRKAPHELNQHETLSKVLGIFNKLVSVARTEELGFYVLNTVIENMGYEIISSYVSHIWNALFTLLQKQHTGMFVKSLLIFMSLFLIKHGSATLVDSVNAIQPNSNLFTNILDKFWVPHLKSITGTIELKLVSVASTRLICESPVLLDPSAAMLWGKMLDSIVTLLSQPEPERVEEEPDVPDIAETVGYTAAFVRLHNAGKKDEDPVKEISDPKELLVRSLAILASASPQRYPTIIQQYLDPTNQEALLELCATYNFPIV